MVMGTKEENLSRQERSFTEGEGFELINRTAKKASLRR